MPAEDLTPTARVDDLGLHLESLTVPLPGFDFDAGKVIARAGSLFPFVTRRSFVDHAVGRSRTTRARLAWAGLEAAPEMPPIAPELVLSDASIQKIVDAAWSRRERWSAFHRIESLANRYDADAGSLPPLLRLYEVQNGLQPYADQTARDPRLWVELGLAADHADFLDFISRFSVSHPGTKARVDVLFLLDKIAQASFDALVTLLDVVPDEDLQWTRQQNAQAFDAILGIQRYYVLQLQKRDLGSRRALAAYYDDLRLRILEEIVETTPGGYRTNDARYLAGEILWKQGNTREAATAWARLAEPDARDEFAAECSELKTIVEASASRIDPLVVDRILRAERGRWLSMSATRLHQFGYHFDTY